MGSDFVKSDSPKEANVDVSSSGSATQTSTAPEPSSPSSVSEQVYKVKGKEFKESELAELVDKGTDYTKKMQKFSAEREQYAPAIQLMTYLNDPGNKAKADKILAIIEAEEERVEEAGMSQNDPYMKEIHELKKELNSMKQMTEQQRKESVVKSVENEIKTVQDKYKDKMSDFDFQNIISRSYYSGENVVKVADDYFEKRGTFESKAKENYVKEKLSEKEKGHQPIGGATPATSEKKLSLGDGSAKRSFIKSLQSAMKGSIEE